MKRFLLICGLFLLTAKVFGQQFLQYNTGTLYDSFENPSQRSFIPDSSRMVAFNFFIPNFGTNFLITGNGQSTFKSRAFADYFNTASLQINKGQYNHVNANANAYSIMLKLFTNLNGNTEIGFFTNTRAEGRGVFTDESFALFNGYLNFPANSYSNVFNDNYSVQAYHQIGFSYREQVTKKFSIGVKVSAISGILHNEVNITRSNVVFDKVRDEATLSLEGNSRITTKLGSTVVQRIGLGFENPGAAISIGTAYRNEDGYNFQYNLKNLGFIHWKGTSSTFRNDTALIRGITSPEREINIRNKLDDITDASTLKNGFTSATNGIAEISINKIYWLGYEQQFRFSPTIIAQKELFYDGFTAALVAPVQYRNFTLSLSTSYNDLRLLTLGGQFMYKTPNSEFFIGSDKLYHSASLLNTAIKGSKAPQTQAVYTTAPYSGADFFIGVSFKFGPVIEHREMASYIPNGDESFLRRLYKKWFRKNDDIY